MKRSNDINCDIVLFLSLLLPRLCAFWTWFLLACDRVFATDTINRTAPLLCNIFATQCICLQLSVLLAVRHGCPQTRYHQLTHPLSTAFGHDFRVRPNARHLVPACVHILRQHCQIHLKNMKPHDYGAGKARMHPCT